MNAIQHFGHSARQRLFAVSSLMFLTGLILIRLESSQSQILSYMQSASLVMVLYGVSLGLSKPAPVPGDLAGLLKYLCFLMTALVAISTTDLGRLGLLSDPAACFPGVIFLDSCLWHEVTASSICLILFYLTAKCMIAIGSELGAALSDLPGSQSWSTVMASGLTSLLLFAALVLCQTPPVIWMAAATSLICLMSKSRRHAILCSTVIIMAALIISRFPPGLFSWLSQDSDETRWSPYQMVQTTSLLNGTHRLGFTVRANRAFNQAALNPSISDSDWKYLRKSYRAEALPGLNRHYYELPFQVVPHPRSVLILGSGCGNDVCQALLSGAGKIDAVELDPVIAKLGDRHPSRPFSDPRVHLHVTDARHFLSTTSSTYDMILMSRLDSQTSTSAFSPLRPSDMSYTTQAIAAMRSHLARGGHLIIGINALHSWIYRRLVLNLRQVFRIVDGGAITACGDYVITTNEHSRDLRSLLTEVPGVLSAPDTIWLNQSSVSESTTTDDHPYFFDEVRALPLPYLWCTYLLVMVMLFCARKEIWFWFDRFNQASGQLVDLNAVQCAGLGAGFSIIQAQASLCLASAFGSTTSVVWGLSAAQAVICLAAGRLARQRLASAPLTWLILLGSLLASWWLWPPASTSSLPGAGESLQTGQGIWWLMVPLILSAMLLSRQVEEQDNLAASMMPALVGGAIGLMLVNLSFITGVNGLSAPALAALLIAALAHRLSGSATTNLRQEAR